MTDQDLPPSGTPASVPGPPFQSSWPPDAPDDGRSARKMPRWGKWCTAIGVVVLAIGVAGSVIRLPYDTLSPGGTLDLATRITVDGKTKSYSPRGDVMLLFVRERTHIDIWRWVQAKLDSEIDLEKQVSVTGGTSQQEADEQDVCDMSQSQESAQVSALTYLGYKVPQLPGLAVMGLFADLPAIKVLQPCDQIVSADGHELKQPDDLSKLIKSHAKGTSVELGIIRAGHAQTVHVPVTQQVVDGKETTVIGVALMARFKIPVHILIDTSDISGPSAGLAMTLAIIDALTPGELTGGKRVAVTGTIDADGNVGEIGGLPQKAVAARASHAQIFIVPACSDAGCRADLATAQKRIGKNVELAPVSTLAQALKVLRDAGGAPVQVPTKT